MWLADHDGMAQNIQRKPVAAGWRTMPYGKCTKMSWLTFSFLRMWREVPNTWSGMVQKKPRMRKRQKPMTPPLRTTCQNGVVRKSVGAWHVLMGRQKCVQVASPRQAIVPKRGRWIGCVQRPRACLTTRRERKECGNHQTTKNRKRSNFAASWSNSLHSPAGRATLLSSWFTKGKFNGLLKRKGNQTNTTNRCASVKLKRDM
mmetsp:Transcript_75702/g.177679  ORF Transcript_75702/g.177679 Transcript_75702/m.177679 type:complete len:202 (-) Transcript_75702:123-728(-)